MSSIIRAASARTFTPSWLAPDDVKSWLKLHGQDSSDDDLIDAVCTQAEAYAQRCRPEWWTEPLETKKAARDTAVPIVTGKWQINPQVNAPPGGMQITCDTGRFATATILNVAKIDQNNNDMTVALETANLIYIQQQMNATNFVYYNVASTLTDWGTYFEIPVTLRESGGAQDSAQWQTAVVALGKTGDPVVPETYHPDDETYQGARMYAAREYRRRNSPAGIETFGDTTSFVSRYDPDIDRALQTGSYARPVIA